MPLPTLRRVFRVKLWPHSWQNPARAPDSVPGLALLAASCCWVLVSSIIAPPFPALRPCHAVVLSLLTARGSRVGVVHLGPHLAHPRFHPVDHAQTLNGSNQGGPGVCHRPMQPAL